MTITDLYAADTFGRTVANGLGTADNGGPWTLSGAASSFSVNGGAGQITGVAVRRTVAAYLTSVAPDRRRHQGRRCRSTSPSNGGGAYVSIIGRRVSNGNDYRLKLRYMAGGSVDCLPRPARRQRRDDPRRTSTVAGPARSIPATCSALASWSPATAPPRCGPRSGARARWSRSAWLLTANDNTPAALQAPGDAGVLLYLSGSWAGALPVLSIDDLKIGPDAGPPVNTPPTASFTSQSEYRKAFFDGGASTDSDEDGAVAGYSWNFGDGTTGTGVNPQHTYAAGGTYNVTLTVTDNGGVTGSLMQPIVVQDPPPPSAFFETDLHVVVSGLRCVGIERRRWRVDRRPTTGTSVTARPGTGLTPHHDYTAAGTYTVTLNVIDNEGNVGTATQTLVLDPVPPPTAAFTATPTFRDVSVRRYGVRPRRSARSPSYAWDFGDGATGTRRDAAAHRTPPPAPTPSRLTVTDSLRRNQHALGRCHGGRTRRRRPRRSRATPNYLSVQFDGTGSSVQFGTITSYAWDFGDGTTGTGATAQHTYATAGTYTVTLTVTGSLGGTDTHSADVIGDQPAAAGGGVHRDADVPQRPVRRHGFKCAGRLDRVVRMGLRRRHDGYRRDAAAHVRDRRARTT